MLAKRADVNIRQCKTPVDKTNKQKQNEYIKIYIVIVYVTRFIK